MARVLVCLEEVDAEYEVVNINLQAKEYLARNVSNLSPVVHLSLDIRECLGLKICLKEITHLTTRIQNKEYTKTAKEIVFGG